MRNDLLSLRARRRLARLDEDDHAEAVTVFSSDGEGVDSEDEDGEETLAVDGGKFAGQDYDRLTQRYTCMKVRAVNLLMKLSVLNMRKAPYFSAF